jgi:hypothetical protein
MLNRQKLEVRRPNDKKEGFSMRRVTFKALAVLVGLAVLMIAAPWFSEVARAQVQVNVSPLELNFTAQEGGPNPDSQQIQITLSTTSSLFYVQWQSAFTASWISIRPTGGGGYISASNPLIQTVDVSVDIRGLRPGDYRATIAIVINGALFIPVTVNLTITPREQPPGGPGPGQVQLTIQARIDNSPLQIPMELTINPPTGGWMRIVTPFSQNFPQNTRIQLVAPERVDGLQFDHWEYPRDPWRPECNFGLTRNILTGPLCFLQTTITAVYRRSEQQPTPPPQLVEYLVSVLYTTWENGIMADPPMARVQVLQGSPNGQPGQVLEFAWIRHPAQAQGLCFRILVGTEDFMGSQVQNIQNYQQVNCQAPPPPVPPSSSVIAELTVDRGCGAIYYVGDPIIVTLRILQTPGGAPVPFQLLDVLPDGRVQRFAFRPLGVGEYAQLRGLITPPRGTETLILQAFLNGQWQNVASCSFQVR